MKKLFLLFCITLLLLSCENKKNPCKEALQNKILNESGGFIELIEFRMTRIDGGEESGLGGFSGIIEFKKDAWKEYTTNRLFGRYNNPFADFKITETNKNTNTDFPFNNFYKKGERVAITGNYYIGDRMETEGEIKYK